jgi:hypothetical protein
LKAPRVLQKAAAAALPFAAARKRKSIHTRQPAALPPQHTYMHPKSLSFL